MNFTAMISFNLFHEGECPSQLENWYQTYSLKNSEGDEHAITFEKN